MNKLIIAGSLASLAIAAAMLYYEKSTGDISFNGPGPGPNPGQRHINNNECIAMAHLLTHGEKSYMCDLTQKFGHSGCSLKSLPNDLVKQLHDNIDRCTQDLPWGDIGGL